MKGIARSFLIFFGILSIQNYAMAEEITIAADVWCPYNCSLLDKDKPGFMVELARTIFERNGVQVKYEVMPWSRAMKLVSNNTIQGLISGTPSNTKVKLIFPEEEQARMQNSFFTLGSNNWIYKGVHSLSEIKLGVIQDYNYGLEIQPYVQRKKKVEIMTGDDPLERLIKMMKMKRIDSILEDKAVFIHTAKNMGFKDYRLAGNDRTPPETNNIFIAFSPTEKSKEYAKMLSKGMKELRLSGELSRILTKYGLKDWK